MIDLKNCLKPHKNAVKPFLNLTFALLIAGLASVFAADPVSRIDPSRYNRPIILACVGDSITADHSPGGYVAQLSRMLKDKWLVENYGVASTTLMKTANKPYQNEGAFQQALASKADVVIIMLGTNDSKPYLWGKKNQFVADYKDLIRQFKALASGPIIFIAKPPFVARQSEKPDINEPNILEELPMIDQIAREENLAVIDIHAATQGKRELFRDGVHPNRDGAGELARTFYTALTGKVFEGPIPFPKPSPKPASPAVVADPSLPPQK